MSLEFRGVRFTFVYQLASFTLTPLNRSPFRVTAITFLSHLGVGRKGQQTIFFSSPGNHHSCLSQESPHRFELQLFFFFIDSGLGEFKEEARNFKRGPGQNQQTKEV